MDPIKTVLIDDNKAFRALVREILQPEEDIHVLDEAGNFVQAKNVLLKCKPDIALLDLSVGRSEGGLDFLKEKTSLDLPTNFIVLSNYEESQYAEKSLQAGAKGFVCKSKAVQCLADAIRSVHSKKEYISSIL